ncbi:MAG: alpha-amylase family protein [Candidatus Ornithospirochaeta sp.]
MSSFENRLKQRKAEMEDIFRRLYESDEKLDDLIDIMKKYHKERNRELKELDKKREKDPLWYKRGDMLGLTMYTDLFAGSLKNLKDKVDYLDRLSLKYLHLMPLLKMPEKDNDGGYAVEDFFSIDPRFGTNEDLAELTAQLRKHGISLCLDFVMNHTASTHEWAKKAENGDKHYQDYYMCFSDRTYPDEYEKTTPEVFPSTAPGNFIWNEKMQKWVLSSFYPFQWDLNYRNPEVLNEMLRSALYLANLGVEVFRLDAVPYIWKKLGTTSRNLPEVHLIVRLMRIVLEIVCPSVILKGEVVMAPKELKAYFGTPEAPECHLLYNVSLMVNFWSSLASQDVRLLEHMAEDILSMEEHCSFVNYIRCHDDIGWGLDEDYERKIGIDPLKHKIFLYRFFEGSFPGSYSLGQLYNYDRVSLDARSCGTTASLCGIENGRNHFDDTMIEMGVKRDLLMHAALYSFRGFPMLSSGDEIGQLNDWSYMNNPSLALDSRNIHRSHFNWDNEKKAQEGKGYEGEIMMGILTLDRVRKTEPCFAPEAKVNTWKSHSDGVFSIRRTIEGRDMLCVMNFRGSKEKVHYDYFMGEYEDLFTKRVVNPGIGFELQPYEYLYLVQDNPDHHI